MKLIYFLHPVPSLEVSGAQNVSNFTFSNFNKTRGCKDILTVEGPVVTIYVTVQTMSTEVFKERGLFISSQGTFVCCVAYNEQLFCTFSALIIY